MIYQFFCFFLFLFSPETAHYLTASVARLVYVFVPFPKKTNNPQKHMNLFFPNKVGLAAGFDKNATMLHWLPKLGFGFIEIGTVTPLPQAGNELPRLFRLPLDLAIINRMGFNNDGVDKIVERLKNRPKHIIVGGNIGKNKITPNELAVNDYCICFNKLFPYVDYFVVNVSSPNTPGLRALQEKSSLIHILSSLQEQELQKKQSKPILLKIAPDLNEQELKDIVEVIKQTKISGVIATNTTIDRTGLVTDNKLLQKIGLGGLSGKPLQNKSTHIIRFLRKLLPKEYVIIGVGGIFSVADAKEKLDAGADLVQLYTGLIYEGPSVVKKIASSI